MLVTVNNCNLFLYIYNIYKISYIIIIISMPSCYRLCVSLSIMFCSETRSSKCHIVVNRLYFLSQPLKSVKWSGWNLMFQYYVNTNKTTDKSSARLTDWQPLLQNEISCWQCSQPMIHCFLLWIDLLFLALDWQLWQLFQWMQEWVWSFAHLTFCPLDLSETTWKNSNNIAQHH